MVLHPTKTKCMVIATQQKHQDSPLSLDLSLQGTPVEEVSEHRVLGLTIDNWLKWKPHTTSLWKILSKKLFLFSKLKHFLDFRSRKMFYNAHIRCHLDYVSTVWDGCDSVDLKKPNSLHRRAAKIILPDPLLSTDEKLEKIGMLPLDKHLMYNKAVFMYKLWNNSTPNYLSHFFQRSNSQYGSSHKLFLLPHPRIETYKSSLSFAGASVWNRLPCRLRSLPTLSRFKESLGKLLPTYDIN